MCTYTVFHRIRMDSRIATHLTAVAKLVIDEVSRFIPARAHRYHRDRPRPSLCNSGPAIPLSAAFLGANYDRA
jgi:hypothetical protein